MVGVDLDKELLEEHKHILSPGTYQWINKRYNELLIKVFAGSVGDRDKNLKRLLPDTSTTSMVSMVELIEHLNPDTLELFSSNLFQFLQPSYIFISTPNSEFNVLFPPSEEKFRHWDHKFEWTRIEFQNWCDGIIYSYPNYTYELVDIGETDESRARNLGPCSQAALFTREKYVKNNIKGESKYTEVAEWKDFTLKNYSVSGKLNFF